MTTKYDGLMEETVSGTDRNQRTPPKQKDPYYDGIIDKAKKR